MCSDFAIFTLLHPEKCFGILQSSTFSSNISYNTLNPFIDTMFVPKGYYKNSNSFFFEIVHFLNDYISKLKKRGNENLYLIYRLNFQKVERLNFSQSIFKFVIV